MARFAFYAVLVGILILLFLGVKYIKDAYQILPIADSEQFEPKAFSDWRRFSAQDGSFSVLLPTFPQTATQNLKDPKSDTVRHYKMYVAQKDNGTAYMVSSIHFDVMNESPETLQRNMVNDLLASNPANQLKDMKVGRYKNFNTLEFTIVNSEMTIEGVSFVDGDILYLLSGIFNNEYYKPEDYKYFIDSFELNHKETSS